MIIKQNTLLEISDKDYFSQTTHTGSTELNTILNHSPQHLLLPKNSDDPAFTLGSALHCKLLTPELFNDTFYALPETINGKATHAGWHKKELAKLSEENKGKRALKAKENDKVLNLVDRVKSSPLYKDYLVGGLAERAVFTTFDDVKIKVKFDYLKPGEYTDVLVDVKTTKIASEKKFFKSIMEYGYDLQMALYRRIAWKLLQKDIMYVWCVVEKEAPYNVCWYGAPDWLIMHGEKKLKKAMDLYKKTVAVGRFPGYPACDELIMIDKPDWIQ